MSRQPRFRRAATLAAIAAAVMIVTPLAASAATAGSEGTAHTTLPGASQSGPDTPIICYNSAITPFQIVNGASTYGRGVMTGCNQPVQECKLNVELEEQVGVLNGWVPVGKPSNPGWSTECVTLQATATYKCQGIIAKRNFRTVSTLTIMNDGASDSATATSPVASLFCD
jgi:hypothetical protein